MIITYSSSKVSARISFAAIGITDDQLPTAIGLASQDFDGFYLQFLMQQTVSRLATFAPAGIKVASPIRVSYDAPEGMNQK